MPTAYEARNPPRLFARECTRSLEGKRKKQRFRPPTKQTQQSLDPQREARSNQAEEDTFISTSPTTIKPAAATRNGEAASPSTTMPTTNAPTAPMPVQIV
jgi:hypothetical protein